MHLLFRERHSLDDEAAADDLGQSPADLLLLSFSDSDLGAAASAWESWPDDRARPTLRLAALRRLRHPMSVDLYLEQTVQTSRCVIVRLLGGLGYWRYGVEQLAALCRAESIALALLPGDGQDDAALQALSTVPAADWEQLARLMDAGGPDHARGALELAGSLAGRSARPALAPPMATAAAGEFTLAQPGAGAWARAALVFYRSHLLSGDVAPIEAVGAALAARGVATRAFYVASLKDGESAGFVAAHLRDWRPHVVLNATAFSARQTGESSLEAAGAPVLQLVLAGSDRQSWAASARGLSATDLAMHVVLPELDGRLLAAAVSFKCQNAAVPALQFARTVHAPDADGVAMAAERAVGWARLAATPARERAVGLVLSDYPGGGRVGHAVGLDTFASVAGMLDALVAGGYTTNALADTALVRGLCDEPARPVITLDAYRALFASLPPPLQAAITAAWGDAAADPSVAADAFQFRIVRCGEVVIAVQPDRGFTLDRKAGYHSPDCPPRHAYVAFYLWLRHVARVHAMVHVGAHGTLEWLPGKSAALSPGCAPAALVGGVPVIYPFIVNNPGEAAAAKRRLGAVTIGHLTPPLQGAGLHGPAAALEALLDEYATADGLDRRRATLLRRDILELAGASGLLAESGAEQAPQDDRLARLDAYLCDVKDARIREGLHVFGRSTARPDCGESEMAALLAALAGRFVAPGPAGAPSRGRADVLPTGRNLYAIDPRAVPTATAMRLAERTAAELLRRHLQEHGEYPRALVLNVWGSAAMRTGGEDLALALILLGVRPEWGAASGRVIGFEILPLAVLDRPRIDVTLRISGLFRDAFAPQLALFEAVTRRLAARDEAADWNPLVAAPGARIYGPAPGCYGAGTEALLNAGAWTARDELGAAYLAASSTAYGGGENAADADGFTARVAASDAFLQVQDHCETDILEGADAAAHAGGFAALAAAVGGAPALYHAETGQAERVALRSTAEEVARIVRTRATNPRWIAGMMRHGYRGATELLRALDGLFAHAACLATRFDPQFDALYAATLGDPAVDAFLRAANPAARQSMAARFAEARRRALWHPQRNDLGELP